MNSEESFEAFADLFVVVSELGACLDKDAKPEAERVSDLRSRVLDAACALVAVELRDAEITGPPIVSRWGVRDETARAFNTACAAVIVQAMQVQRCIAAANSLPVDTPEEAIDKAINAVAAAQWELVRVASALVDADAAFGRRIEAGRTPPGCLSEKVQ